MKKKFIKDNYILPFGLPNTPAVREYLEYWLKMDRAKKSKFRKGADGIYKDRPSEDLPEGFHEVKKL